MDVSETATTAYIELSQQLGNVESMLSVLIALLVCMGIVSLLKWLFTAF